MLLAPDRPNLTRSDEGFLSKYAALLDLVQRTGDFVIIVTSALVSYWLTFGSLHPRGSYPLGIMLALLLVPLIFPRFGLYHSWRGLGLASEIVRVWAAWAAVMATFYLLSWMLRSSGAYPPLWVLGWFVGGLLLFGLSRFASARVLGILRARGIDTRKVVLVGATRAGKQIVEATRDNPWMGLQVIGYVETPYDLLQVEDVPCLGNLDAFLATFSSRTFDQLWIALPMRAEEAIHKVLNAVGDAPTTIRLIPDLFSHELLNHYAAKLAGIPVITLRSTRIYGHAHVIKAIEDLVLATLILILISPLMVLLAIGVKLSSRGPVLFRQKRHGLNGREVEVWKFRSMRAHHEAAGEVTQAKPGDPRVTRFGRFLRSSSLDELPQFFNVLQGTMSIVGPRPHAIEHNHHYKKLVQHYMQRHHVKPGITGWAQIHGLRGETDTVEKMAIRVEYDLYYIRSWSLSLDLRIIFATIFKGFFGRNAY